MPGGFILITSLDGVRHAVRYPFALIGNVGEDCAGAVQFVRPERLDEVKSGATPALAAIAFTASSSGRGSRMFTRSLFGWNSSGSVGSSRCSNRRLPIVDAVRLALSSRKWEANQMKERVAEIVAAYVGKNQLDPAELPR
jgi:hypothetical protein